MTIKTTSEAVEAIYNKSEFPFKPGVEYFYDCPRQNGTTPAEIHFRIRQERADVRPSFKREFSNYDSLVWMEEK